MENIKLKGKARDFSKEKIYYIQPLYPVSKHKKGIRWMCKCDCGNLFEIDAMSLASGKTKSCGCKKKELISNWAHNLSCQKHLNKTYNNLTILEIDKNYYANCKCFCGNTKNIKLSAILEGNTKSCGCYKPKKHNYIEDREEVKIRKQIRKFTYQTLRRTLNEIKKDKTEKILGYSQKELRQYLESKFTDKINWSNYGTYWHIDHIKPINQFIKEGIINIKIINALSNLQPLEAKLNLSKGCKYE